MPTSAPVSRSKDLRRELSLTSPSFYGGGGDSLHGTVSVSGGPSLTGVGGEKSVVFAVGGGAGVDACAGVGTAAPATRLRTVFGNWTAPAEEPPLGSRTGSRGHGSRQGNRPGSRSPTRRPGSRQSSPTRPRSGDGGQGKGFGTASSSSSSAAPSARDLGQVWQHVHPQLFSGMSDGEKKKLFKVGAVGVLGVGCGVCGWWVRVCARWGEVGEG